MDMDALLSLILGLLFGGAIGALATAMLLTRRAAAGGRGGDALDPALVEARHRAELSELRAAEESARASLSAEIAAMRVALAGSREQLERSESQFRERLEQTGRMHREQSAQQEERLRDFQTRLRELQAAEAERAESDGRVLVALSPVQETLQAVQRKVQELEEQRHQQYGELSEQLRAATESEERLRATAESLAAALRSNSTRGVWGETQLRSVVEAAGLLERVDFDVQSSITSDAGAGRPDMVVHLPGGKSIAVDAKVPFTSYLEASAIPANASEPELARRERLLKQHVKAVRDHITALGSRTYWAGLGSSPEMVIAFIPSESLVASALEADPSILEYAFSKRVALSSPVTLWSVLKTVAFSWQQSVLTEDAKELFDLSRELYSRIATTANHVDKLGRSIKGTVADYNRFVGSLERQVLPSARRLSALDSSKLLPPLAVIEDATRDLTAMELLAELDAARDELAGVRDELEGARE
jgi:DNA recombination protein RmuC